METLQKRIPLGGGSQKRYSGQDPLYKEFFAVAEAIPQQADHERFIGKIRRGEADQHQLQGLQTPEQQLGPACGTAGGIEVQARLGLLRR
jgi:hypothetical protein